MRHSGLRSIHLVKIIKLIGRRKRFSGQRCPVDFGQTIVPVLINTQNCYLVLARKRRQIYKCEHFEGLIFNERDLALEFF
jgi:hypothetical protein